MNTLSLNQFLVLYTWFPLAALLLFVLLIARFYQKFSGKRTRFRLFTVPLVLFGAGAVRYTSVNGNIGDPLADLLFGAAGIVLLALCWRLHRLMLAQNPAHNPPQTSS